MTNVTEYKETTLGNYDQESTTFLSTLSGNFTDGWKKQKEEYMKAFQAVKDNSSDPAALAEYQAKLAEYTLYRNAQSNAVKAFKDTDANTIRNFN